MRCNDLLCIGRLGLQSWQSHVHHAHFLLVTIGGSTEIIWRFYLTFCPVRMIIMNQLVALQICSVCSNCNGVLLVMWEGAENCHQSVQWMSRLKLLQHVARGSLHIWYHYSAIVHDRKMLFGILIDNVLKMMHTNFDGPTSSGTKVVNITIWVIYEGTITL